jgi:hypothetical protein
VPYGSRRLPLGNARQIEVEQHVAEVTADRGKTSVQPEVFWSKDLLFFEAAGPGSSLTVPFDVPEDGRYELVAQLAHAPDYGIYTVELDGQSAASSAALEHEPGANMGDNRHVDPYHSEIYVAEDHLIGWATLTRGRHTLRFVCAGKNSASSAFNLGIDTLILAKIGASDAADPALSRADAIRAIVAHTPASVGDVAALTKALADPDHVVRGLAAIGLRNAGKAAASAREPLLLRLKDDDVGVRMVATQALGRLQDPSLLEPLVAAGREPGQHTHVLRAVADALGALGPAARPALPLLRDLEKLPRVQWAARAAITKIP